MGELLCVRGENDLYKITEPISKAGAFPSKPSVWTVFGYVTSAENALATGMLQSHDRFPRESQKKALSFVPLGSLTQSSLRMLGKAHTALVLFSAE